MPHSILAVVLAFVANEAGAIIATRKGPNVLFIVADDMRPAIGAYNFSLAKTPTMDRFATESLVFKRSYVQYPSCAPSRASFMSGRRPDTTRVWNFMDNFREVGSNWSTMPEYFKNHGFLTLASGKVFHHGRPHDNDWPRSWSQDDLYFSPECPPEKCPHSSHMPGGKNGVYRCLYADPTDWRGVPDPDPTVCIADTNKDESRPAFQLEDQKILHNCINQLETATARGKQFFIGCGFHKPHTPWIVPKEFYDKYPDKEDIPLPKFGHTPTGMPHIAWHTPADVHGLWECGFDEACQDEQRRQRIRLFRRGYYAAMSYTDYNIGKLLDAVDRLGLKSNTAVIITSDHGFHLGEQATWSKFSNFEISLRTPTMMRVPWFRESAGRVTDVLAEAVDFYPTLAELAGLPDPRSEGEEINGTSLVPVFLNPDNTSIKTAAFSQFAKWCRSQEFGGAVWPTPFRHEIELMGYSVRVDKWRYTVWFGFDKIALIPWTGDIVGRELYFHNNDGDDDDFSAEDVNVAGNPANAAVVAELHRKVLDYIRLYPANDPRPFQVHQPPLKCRPTVRRVVR